MGEVTSSDLSGDMVKNSAILGKLYKKGFAEREKGVKREGKRGIPYYKYQLSEKGRKIKERFGSYKKYRMVTSSSVSLLQTFNEESELAKKINE